MSAYNLYRGNGGRARRVEDTPAAPKPPPKKPKPPHSAPPPAGLPILRDLPRKLGELETEDILLILILYLMYRESGDKELLVIIGAMYLL